MNFIVTRPEHDITTKYLSAWAGEIISLAENKKINVIDLWRDKANRDDLVGRVKKWDPELIFLNGHGGDDCISGQDNRILIKAGDNHEILQKRITYALSCNSGKILGQKVAEDNTSTYIGYSDEFIFVGDSNYISRPLVDPKAEPFKEASNQLMISLLKGNSAKDASERSKEKFRENIRKLTSSIADSDSLQIAQCLWWNMRHQVCLGNIEAKL